MAQARGNDSHTSTTDPDARLYRKGPGQEAKLCFIGHALMENRHGLVVAACLTRTDGRAERIEEVFGWAKSAAGLRKIRHPRPGPLRLPDHLHPGRLQPDPASQAAGASRRTRNPRPAVSPMRPSAIQQAGRPPTNNPQTPATANSNHPRQAFPNVLVVR
jgi:hypothetical protein